VKIEECVNERKIEEIMLLKCSNKRNQQKGKNRKKKSNDCKIEIHHFNTDKLIWTCYHDWIINLDFVILIDKMINYLTSR
jgi:hypothetical protein